MTGKLRDFGESQTSIRAAKRFMIAFGQQPRDEQTRFLEANIEQLDKSWLEVLPFVFQEMVEGKNIGDRWNIAVTFGDFGIEAQQFPRGIRWLNLELSIKAYELALQIFTREAFPQYWALAQMNLGSAYCDRIRGERAENLEEAIAAYQRALQIFTREAFPQDWALTQMGLGNAYLTRIRGERAENLEEAIAAYQLALQVFTREAFPQDWASTQVNLGCAYSDRIQGERTENLERAKTYHELSLEIYTYDANPERWAIAQHNLADVYRDRLQGNPEENIEQAISLYDRAAKVFTQDAYPHDWFYNQAHLATAYLKRATLHADATDQLADIETAIALLQEVLATANPNDPTPDYIDAQYQLGNALKRRHDRTQDPADLQQALKAYTTAFRAISAEHYDREKMWQALPETQTILGSRLVRNGEWHQGLELLQAALNQLAPHGLTNPHTYAYALYQVGRTHEIMSNWKDARIYYRDALRIYEYINDEPGMARCHHGLGAIFGCQGAFAPSTAELAKARNLYARLGMNEAIEEVNDLQVFVDAGQRELERLSLIMAT